MPSSSNRHSSTLSQFSENSEKFVPAPSQVAPWGNGRPGRSVVRSIIGGRLLFGGTPSYAAGWGVLYPT